jgi:hypothetical protein
MIKMENTCKELSLTKVLSLHLDGGIEVNHEKGVRIAGLRPEIDDVLRCPDDGGAKHL